jgi:hypothetical protein
MLCRALRAPLATSPGSIGQDSRGQNGLVVRSFVVNSFSEYGSSTGYLLFTMYGERRGNAIQAPLTHVPPGWFVMIRPRQQAGAADS